MKIRHYYPRLYKWKKKSLLSSLSKVTMVASSRVRKAPNLAVSKDFIFSHHAILIIMDFEYLKTQRNLHLQKECRYYKWTLRFSKELSFSLLSTGLLLFLLQEFTRKFCWRRLEKHSDFWALHQWGQINKMSPPALSDLLEVYSFSSEWCQI